MGPLGRLLPTSLRLVVVLRRLAAFFRAANAQAATGTALLTAASISATTSAGWETIAT